MSRGKFSEIERRTDDRIDALWSRAVAEFPAPAPPFSCPGRKPSATPKPYSDSWSRSREYSSSKTLGFLEFLELEGVAWSSLGGWRPSIAPGKRVPPYRGRVGAVVSRIRGLVVREVGGGRRRRAGGWRAGKARERDGGEGGVGVDECGRAASGEIRVVRTAGSGSAWSTGQRMISD